MESRLDSTYVPLGSRASWAKSLLLLAGAIDCVALVTGFALIRLVDELQQTGWVDIERFDTADSRHALVGTLQIAVYVVAGIAFLRWFHRAYANLPAIGVDKTRHRPGWAIGAWFIPLASLVWPKRFADEIWRGSDPDGESAERKVPSLYGAWWRTFVISGIVVAIGSNVWTSAETESQLELGAMVEFIGNLVGVASGVLAYLVVDRLSERQQARAVKLGAGPTS
ncbi:MAG TPA: DUF4328 domain-containing protein [Gaiellaceae bacterium]|nr:DUF4328 domain-containing protein [Gaiellaceae bacterium]